MVLKESKSRASKVLDFVIYVCFGVLIVIILFKIFSFVVVEFSEGVIIPAYMSTLSNCGVEPPSKNIDGAAIYTQVGSYNVKTGDIFVSYSQEKKPKEYRATLKHELTHKLQAEWGILSGCSNPKKVFLNEVYAELSENIPLWDVLMRMIT